MTATQQGNLADLLPGLLADPRLYVHSFDFGTNSALVIKVPDGFFRDTIFLDARSLKDISEGAHVPLETLLGILKGGKAAPTPAHFIFHIGHCGSTLVSRVLDSIPGVWGLREPMTFRLIAEAKNAGQNIGDIQKRLMAAYLLTCRRFSNDQKTIIKTTSTCNTIAPDLLSIHKDNRALCLFITLEQYAANMAMKKEPKDVFNFHDHCKASLFAAIPDLKIGKAGGDLGKMMAVNWLGAVMDLFRLYESPLKNRCLFLDFDQILEGRDKAFSRITGHFQLAAIPSGKAEVAFGSYSKLPGFQYTPEDRALNLAASKRENSAVIEGALDYAKQLADRSEKIASALKAFRLSA